ncbi:MAG: rhodanese-like domain-containing protein [Planctomycetaceae bacterium]|nr:rhodanese-like domain-containing protein [Planctomycetaceae bacterium]
MADSLRGRLVQIACDISNQLRDVAEVSVEEILAKGVDQFVFVDVRPPAERDVSMIPGAVTAEEFARRQQVGPPSAGHPSAGHPAGVDADHADDGPIKQEGQMIVAYCTAGYRSGVFAREQNKRGQPVVNLRGGLLSWCDQQQPLTTADGQPTHRVHVYSRMWNLVSNPYEGVW